jgi:hypothetical protein
MLKAAMPSLANIFAKLFNTILQQGCYPEQWSIGYIVNILKSGDRSDPNNYRGITINSSLGKLFSNILNSRFEEYVERKKSRLRVRPKLVLKKVQEPLTISLPLIPSLTNIFKKINAIFMYALSTFERLMNDSVWHDGLFLKLLKCNIRGNFYKVTHRALHVSGQTGNKVLFSLAENKVRHLALSFSILTLMTSLSIYYKGLMLKYMFPVSMADLLITCCMLMIL